MREHNIPEPTMKAVDSRIGEAQRRVAAALQGLLVENGEGDAAPTLI